jgi:hypothetical protein
VYELRASLTTCQVCVKSKADVLTLCRNKEVIEVTFKVVLLFCIAETHNHPFYSGIWACVPALQGAI